MLLRKRRLNQAERNYTARVVRENVPLLNFCILSLHHVLNVAGYYLQQPIGQVFFSFVSFLVQWIFWAWFGCRKKLNERNTATYRKTRKYNKRNTQNVFCLDEQIFRKKTYCVRYSLGKQVASNFTPGIYHFTFTDTHVFTFLVFRSPWILCCVSSSVNNSTHKFFYVRLRASVYFTHECEVSTVGVNVFFIKCTIQIRWIWYSPKSFCSLDTSSKQTKFAVERSRSLSCNCKHLLHIHKLIG